MSTSSTHPGTRPGPGTGTRSDPGTGDVGLVARIVGGALDAVWEATELLAAAAGGAARGAATAVVEIWVTDRPRRQRVRHGRRRRWWRRGGWRRVAVAGEVVALYAAVAAVTAARVLVASGAIGVAGARGARSGWTRRRPQARARTRARREQRWGTPPEAGPSGPGDEDDGPTQGGPAPGAAAGAGTRVRVDVVDEPVDVIEGEVVCGHQDPDTGRTCTTVLPPGTTTEHCPAHTTPSTPKGAGAASPGPHPTAADEVIVDAELVDDAPAAQASEAEQAVNRELGWVALCGRCHRGWHRLGRRAPSCPDCGATAMTPQQVRHYRQAMDQAEQDGAWGQFIRRPFLTPASSVTTATEVIVDAELVVDEDEGRVVVDDARAGQERPSRRWDRAPESDRDRRFFDLREAGYQGPVDRDGYAVAGHATADGALPRRLTEDEVAAAIAAGGYPCTPQSPVGHPADGSAPLEHDDQQEAQQMKSTVTATRDGQQVGQVQVADGRTSTSGLGGELGHVDDLAAEAATIAGVIEQAQTLADLLRRWQEMLPDRAAAALGTTTAITAAVAGVREAGSTGQLVEALTGLRAAVGAAHQLGDELAAAGVAGDVGGVRAR